ncbi:chitooligosaccharide oxidase [Metarhizium guizhouense ARSEF 977]|uniref:Chitooligosaccharide oxidase n=1 Tax=Metarhizium guizhouense (strain ARSEF 977) TaxID=1276136 RepID=A0A0B4HTE1_METGA|nr:chitooligosaccharide oxidase [Metarhizium guizhouense ARSEF 977]
MTRFSLQLIAGLAGQAWLVKSDTPSHDALASCLSDASVPIATKGTPEWTQHTTPFNTRLQYEPIAVAVPTEISQIAAAVTCAKKNSIPVTAKSGGHSFTSLGLGGEDGHLVIQLDRMYNVELAQNGTARIQSGARLGHVAVELYNQGKRALSHGYCPAVGVGGHAAHGGYGMVSRKYGLTLDWMKDATVVLYNGTIVYCSKSEHSDLFWAIRGAGSSFGIVAEYGFETFPAPEKVTNFGIVLDWDTETAPSGLLAFQDFAQTMPSELSCQIDVRSTGYTLNGSYVGNEASLREALVPLLGKIGGHLEVHEGNWLEYVKFWALGQPNIDITPPADNVHLSLYTTGALTPSLSANQFRSFADYIATDAIKRGNSWSIQMFIHGGQYSAISGPKITDTAYAHRDKFLIFQFTDFVWPSQEYPEDGLALGREFRDIITNSFTNSQWGMYANVPDSQLSSGEAQKLYWGKNLERLETIKAKYDPNNLFRNPQSVKATARCATRPLPLQGQSLLF